MPMQNSTFKNSNYIRFYFILSFFFSAIFSAFGFNVSKSGQTYDQVKLLLHLTNEISYNEMFRIELGNGIKNKISPVFIVSLNGYNFTGTSSLIPASNVCNVTATNSVKTSHGIVDKDIKWLTRASLTNQINFGNTIGKGSIA